MKKHFFHIQVTPVTTPHPYLLSTPQTYFLSNPWTLQVPTTLWLRIRLSLMMKLLTHVKTMEDLKRILIDLSSDINVKVIILIHLDLQRVKQVIGKDIFLTNPPIFHQK